MILLLVEVCREIKRFFTEDSEQGDYIIKNGVISGLKNSYPVGTHMLIERFKNGSGGSMLNAGIYSVEDTLISLVGARDEEWIGRIHLCVFPRDFLALVKEIEEFTEAEGRPTSIVSESFGNASYSRAVAPDGQPIGWRDVFRKRLIKYQNVMLYNVNV